MKKNPYTEPQDNAGPFNPEDLEAAAGAPEAGADPENTTPEAHPGLYTQAEVDDIRLRSLAEMENFKRRLQREHEESGKYAAESVLADLLPALDSLDLAIRYADKDKDSGMLQGVVMTRKLLLDALKAHGLEPVGEETEPFNHELHEAVGEEERDDMPEKCVSCLMQRGYKLKDRLLRPAKVLVSRQPS